MSTAKALKTQNNGITDNTYKNRTGRNCDWGIEYSALNSVQFSISARERNCSRLHFELISKTLCNIFDFAYFLDICVSFEPWVRSRAGRTWCIQRYKLIDLGFICYTTAKFLSNHCWSRDPFSRGFSKDGQEGWNYVNTYKPPI